MEDGMMLSLSPEYKMQIIELIYLHQRVLICAKS